jgi:hypothetical protein
MAISYECRYCHQPIQPCKRRKCAFYDCKGWLHSADKQHSCQPAIGDWQSAEPPKDGA